MEEYSDAELFNMLTGEKSLSDRAFTELYSRYSPRVYAYCRRFLGEKESALDVFQETFVRFYNCASQNREMTNVAAFLLKIARNLCLNAKKKDQTTISFEEYMVGREDNPDRNEMLNLVKMALDLIPNEYRDVFILREYDGMSYAEISEITDLSISTIKVRIFRAKQKIREILAPYMAEFTKFS